MQASEETIKQMILKNSNISFETSISNNQKLTFSYVEKIFDEKGINIINIYKDTGIEFINYGSLYGNITIEDILEGLSTTRNPHLQSLFMRLEYVEAIGSGLKRVNEYYNNLDLKMEIKALPASFIVKLPKIEANIENTNVQCVKLSDKDRIIKCIKENGFITRKECEKIIEKEKTATLDLLNQLLKQFIIERRNRIIEIYNLESED